MLVNLLPGCAITVTPQHLYLALDPQLEALEHRKTMRKHRKKPKISNWAVMWGHTPKVGLSSLPPLGSKGVLLGLPWA